MRAVLVLAALLLASGTPVSAEDDVKTLAKVGGFAFGGVGVAGQTSEGEIAFRKVFASPTAKDDFLTLLRSKNPQAVCYALVALRKLDPAVYAKTIEDLRTKKTMVTTVMGCTISDMPMASVVKFIDSGAYDRYLPDD